MSMESHVNLEIVIILMNLSAMSKLKWNKGILLSLDMIIMFNYLMRLQIERKDINWQNFIHLYYQQIF
ncbi:Uncharacterised protein [Staphylococcus aureus]|nr:Uncharacterised protein [Staphylococcus aureus]